MVTFQQIVGAIDRRNIIITQHARDQSFRRCINFPRILLMIKDHSTRVWEQKSNTSPERSTLLINTTINGTTYGSVWEYRNGAAILLTIFIYDGGEKYRFAVNDEYCELKDYLQKAS